MTQEDEIERTVKRWAMEASDQMAVADATGRWAKLVATTGIDQEWEHRERDQILFGLAALVAPMTGQTDARARVRRGVLVRMNNDALIVLGFVLGYILIATLVAVGMLRWFADPQLLDRSFRGVPSDSEIAFAAGAMWPGAAIVFVSFLIFWAWTRGVRWIAKLGKAER